MSDLLEVNRYTGQLHRLHRHGEELAIETVEDCTSALDMCHRIRQDARNARADWRLSAHIPDIVVTRWLDEGVNIFDPDDEGKVTRLLNGPYKYLKCVDQVI